MFTRYSTNRAMQSFALIILLCTAIAGTANEGPVNPPQNQNGTLSSILGEAANDWIVYGEPRLLVSSFRGQPVLEVGPGGLTLGTRTPLAMNSDLRVRFRMADTAERAASTEITPGLSSPDVRARNPLTIRTVAHADGSAQRNRSPESLWVNGSRYNLRNLPGTRFRYPDMARVRMEQDYAALESINERWLTARHLLRTDTVQQYIDGRFLGELPMTTDDGNGHVRITISQGVHLAGISVTPLPPFDPRFDILDIGPYANASNFFGAKIPVDSSLRHDPIQRVGGVPFVMAEPDMQGRDHLDLGMSWAKFGLGEGYICPAQRDPARWRGARHRQDGRIQLRVPNGPYTHLHLLAAFAGEPDTTPVVTAQFYRPSAGHPVNFEARVPAFTAPASSVESAASLPVTLSNGKEGRLYHVSIPLEPNGLAAFVDQPALEFELTKEVTIYRAFPDPLFYSMHQAGLPSGVHVFAATLERSPVDLTFDPDQYGHIWTAPETPSYTATLTNRTDTAQSVRLTLSTRSHDGLEETRSDQTLEVPPGNGVSVTLPIELERYGHHTVRLEVEDVHHKRTIETSLAFLHHDTRERGNWEEGRGPIFGFWDWGGGHGTPRGIPRLEVMRRAGVESSMRPLTGYPEEEQAYLEKHNFVSHYLGYKVNPAAWLGADWDPSKPEEMGAAIVARMKESDLTTPSPIHQPDLAVFFAEPQLGPVSSLSQPEFFGEPEYELTEPEQARYQSFKDQFLIAARAIKQEWPHARMIFPWGIPSFPIPYLKYSPEVTELMDGPGVDVVLFERPPEMQIHQVTFASVMWQLKETWRTRTDKPWPNLMSIEGPVPSPTMPGAITPRQEADHFVRANLILNAGYNVTRLLGFPSVAQCSGFWGEQHYGGGLLERIPLLNPKIGYVAFATLTRQLNRMNFVKTIPSDSHSVFALQYRHYRTGEILHVFWTLRGTRPVTLSAPDAAAVSVYDQNDNATSLVTQDGKVTFDIGTSPVYVWGLKDVERIVLGEPDHSDAEIGEVRHFLGNLGDGTWEISTERDEDYEQSHYLFIRRFPGVMSVDTVAAPDEAGGVALAVRLEEQERERRVMPFYTTLKPAEPIEIDGKPSHLGLWVKAAGDWGRVVYFLRDAEGERWISVGQKDEWNVDDVHCWSAFNYDGWRYLRFELPGNAPYDLFREKGTSFWGHYGVGDGIVDLPLSLEKIVVERRTHVIKLDELLPADPSDVLLGDLFAEYVRDEDSGDDAVRVSRLRMPMPETLPELPNPIAELRASGEGDAPVIASIEPPERQYDGTRCHVYFEPVANAKHYDIWVSPYEDGRGALHLARAWTEPGRLLTGLNANTDLYLFLTATFEDDTTTPPSPAFHVNLINMFPFR